MWFGLVLIVIGAVLLLEKLGVIEGGLSTFWPLILIAIGMAIVFGNARRRSSRS